MVLGPTRRRSRGRGQEHMPGRSHGANGRDCAAQACGAVSVRASDQQECCWMGRGSVPGGPGWRIHPCGRDTWRTIRNPGDREPGEPCPDWQRWNPWDAPTVRRSEEHTSELQSLMRISYAVFCLKKKNKQN